MKSIVIVGGKLQGTEACYLGMKADINVTLIDIDPGAPAKKLCDKFICGDVLNPDEAVIDALKNADMVLPTMENDALLEALEMLSEELGFIYAFDLPAYGISKSKKLSDILFRGSDVPAPDYYPGGDAPYIAKPDDQSGSHGVEYLRTREDAAAFRESNPEAIIQEYLNGPVYSIEIIGKPGNYRTYEITEIHTDETYDCKMVTTPCDISSKKKEVFIEEAIKIAELMKLRGIMDYEAIDTAGGLKMLEIDARLPSQTPIAVYRASGMNMVEELYDLFVCGDFKKKKKVATKHVAFEHYTVSDSGFKGEGEHIMTMGKPLHYIEGFCGSREAITDYPSKPWRVAFINSEGSREALDERRKEVMRCLKNIR